MDFHFDLGHVAPVSLCINFGKRHLLLFHHGALFLVIGSVLVVTELVLIFCSAPFLQSVFIFVVTHSGAGWPNSVLFMTIQLLF